MSLETEVKNSFKDYKQNSTIQQGMSSFLFKKRGKERQSDEVVNFHGPSSKWSMNFKESTW